MFETFFYLLYVCMLQENTNVQMTFLKCQFKTRFEHIFLIRLICRVTYKRVYTVVEFPSNLLGTFYYRYLKNRYPLGHYEGQYI